jgi:hypothetical protein
MTDDQTQNTIPPVALPPTPVLPDADLPLQIHDYPLPPDAARKWNWGAALLAPFWLAGMRHWAYLTVYLVFWVFVVIMAFINEPLAKFLNFVVLIISWYLLRHGNALAWQSRPWRSVEHFQRTQRVWLWWGLGALVGQLALGFGIAAFMDWANGL